MDFVQKSNFLSSVFLGQIKPQKIVLVLWIKKMLFKGEKGSFKNFKKSKFSKGVSHGFCQTPARLLKMVGGSSS